MMLFALSQSLLFLTTSVVVAAVSAHRCRSQPGDASFPTSHQLAAFNSSIDGRLINVAPSAKLCMTLPGGCTDAEWQSGIFRDNIPGAMLQVNWEQDYDSNPPSLCFRNSTNCGQGNVPIFGVNASTAAQIQAGVRFAQAHNLKIAIKASGHDYLGRSTAKNSILMWTRNFQNITFHDSFQVGQKIMGSAVTVGSGVGMQTLYMAAKAQGKIFSGARANTAVLAGGYVQGAGHAPLAPTLGLAADNALEFQIVIADGSLVTANEASNPDLFWALRGGGAGSWGVIISATFRVFPTFDAVLHTTTITVNSTEDVRTLSTLHAQHIFDMDPLHPGQYYRWLATPPTFTGVSETHFPNTSIEAVNATLAPYLNAASELGFHFDVSITRSLVNDILTGLVPDDQGGVEFISGSRLLSDDVYRQNATAVGVAYKLLLDGGVSVISECLVAGGKVSRNANISSAVTPKWRTAKTHVIINLPWSESTTPDKVEAVREDMTHNKVPILAALAGPGSGSYSNEADVREPDFQTTFFGPNFARLSEIKKKYDPEDLFIVGAGVGSENWDSDGLCRVGK
ncbi:FAD-binding domain-containing protein [Gautieria morchelliformis]|nr:FAD-binding domain-containing protein [Gautieria morchelliformis]